MNIEGNFKLVKGESLIQTEKIPVIKTDANNKLEAAIKSSSAVSTNEDGLVEIDDSEEIDDVTPKGNDNVGQPITSMGTPREVVVSDKPNEKQQETLDEMVNDVLNKTYGFKDLEVADNVVYRNEDGVLTKQEIVQKNDNDEEIKITITYDEKGRIKEVASVKYVDGNACDGSKIEITYNEDGTITVQPKMAYGDGDGPEVNILVYIPPTVIDQEGNRNISFYGSTKPATLSSNYKVEEN